jgi:dihydroorotate dehydrogenase
MTLIGAGGITTAEDALQRLEAGADLLQGYTGFVYEGPWWPARLNARISASLQTTKSTSEESSREKSSNDRRSDR